MLQTLHEPTAAVIISSQLSEMSEKTRVEALPGKGFGLVANIDLSPGQVILEQPPLMLVDFKLNDEEVRDRDVIDQRLTPLIEEQLKVSIT